ncbi:MAG: ABC transporter permease [Halanaerobiales bacterium]
MSNLKRILTTILFIILFWWLVALVVDNPVLPVPGDVFVTFYKLSSRLGVHIMASFYRIITGVGISLLIGIPLGLLIGRIKKVDKFAAPLIYLAYPVPKIAFLPLVLLFLGLGDVSKIFLISLIVFFQILVHARDAAREINDELILSVKSLGATDLQLFWKVVFPASLPRIFTAVRISTGTAIAVLFFTETFATFTGLGYFIMDAWTRVNYREMFAGITALSLLGLFLFLFVDIVERLACPWLYLEKNN